MSSTTSSSSHMSLLDQCMGRISFYQNTTRLRSDVQVLFYNCSSLRPNVGSFQSPTGALTLFYLSGVIPIGYKGANYNIPVTIYLDPPYPNQPPRVFVTPTADMVIKPNHKHVDQNGRVYLPDLSQWKPHNSSLVSIVGVLSSIFSAEPPVNSVKKNSSISPSPSPPPVVVPVVVASVSPRIKRDQLIKSLSVKIRAKLPAKLKSEIDALNQSRAVEASVRDNGVKLTRARNDLAFAKDRIEKRNLSLINLGETNNDWISRYASPRSRPVDMGLTGGEDNQHSFLEADSVLGQQVMDLVAEECAYEDLIDSLYALCREGRLALPDMLREIRAATRKIFEIKAILRRSVSVLISKSATASTYPKLPIDGRRNSSSFRDNNSPASPVVATRGSPIVFTPAASSLIR